MKTFDVKFNSRNLRNMPLLLNAYQTWRSHNHDRRSLRPHAGRLRRLPGARPHGPLERLAWPRACRHGARAAGVHCIGCRSAANPSLKSPQAGQRQNILILSQDGLAPQSGAAFPAPIAACRPAWAWPGQTDQRSTPSRIASTSWCPFSRASWDGSLPSAVARPGSAPWRSSRDRTPARPYLQA